MSCEIGTATSDEAEVKEEGTSEKHVKSNVRNVKIIMDTGDRFMMCPWLQCINSFEAYPLSISPGTLSFAVVLAICDLQVSSGLPLMLSEKVQRTKVLKPHYIRITLFSLFNYLAAIFCIFHYTPKNN